MYEDVLVPTDGSDGAEAAAVRALDIARSFESRVHALYVGPDATAVAGITDADVAELVERAEQQGRTATLDVQNRAEEFDVDVVREVREGTPYRAILEYAAEADVDLVALGAHGRGGPERTRLGSTAERVLTHADVPVLVVPEAAAGDPASGYRLFDEIVVATDGSEAATRAAEHALGIAERYGADINVVYVVDPSSLDVEQLPRSMVGLLKEGGEAALDGITGEARDRSLPVSKAILRGDPETAILQYAEGVDADLVAMGTRGERASDDRLLGSTTARVVRRSDVPVLAVS